MNKNITIIGCGWLGRFIGEELIKQGYSVNGSYRSDETREALILAGIHPFQFETDTTYRELPEEIIRDTDLLILSIPPFDKDEPEKYAIALQNIAAQLEDKTRVIFTSSTGIYPQKEGAFDEDYEFLVSEKLTPLYLAEKGLTSILGDRLLILRLGGLIGGDRHPIKFVAGRQMKTRGNEPVHLIHRADIASFILFTLERSPTMNGVYNFYYPINLTKKEYYRMLAEKNKLTPPQFTGEKNINRSVSGKRLQNINGYYLKFDPLEFTFESN